MDPFLDFLIEHRPLVLIALFVVASVFFFFRLRRSPGAKVRPIQQVELPPALPVEERVPACEWEDDILLYARGRMPGLERDRFAAHCRHCDSCRHGVEELRESAVCPYDRDVKSLHGEKPIQVGSGGRLRAHWVAAANEHAKTCSRCTAWTKWLFSLRRTESEDVKNLESSFASAPKTDRT